MLFSSFASTSPPPFFFVFAGARPWLPSLSDTGSRLSSRPAGGCPATIPPHDQTLLAAPTGSASARPLQATNGWLSPLCSSRDIGRLFRPGPEIGDGRCCIPSCLPGPSPGQLRILDLGCWRLAMLCCCTGGNNSQDLGVLPPPAPGLPTGRNSELCPIVLSPRWDVCRRAKVQGPPVRHFGCVHPGGVLLSRWGL